MLVFNVLGIVARLRCCSGCRRTCRATRTSSAAVDPRVAFNTAVSFATNTNWQAYGGETTMSHLVQAVALGVQNFVSAATGMAVLVALIRGFTRKHAETIGNFWVDLTRSTLYILLPLSIVHGACCSSHAGRAADHRRHGDRALLDAQPGTPSTSQARCAGHRAAIALGPVASQVAIKQLGTNGGGFFNVNSAHPLENPTPLSNFFECLAILLIPAALCFTFGRMVELAPAGLALLVDDGDPGRAVPRADACSRSSSRNPR